MTTSYNHIFRLRIATVTNSTTFSKHADKIKLFLQYLRGMLK